jgi:hypothetical protein
LYEPTLPAPARDVHIGSNKKTKRAFYSFIHTNDSLSLAPEPEKRKKIMCASAPLRFHRRRSSSTPPARQASSSSSPKPYASAQHPQYGAYHLRNSAASHPAASARSRGASQLLHGAEPEMGLATAGLEVVRDRTGLPVDRPLPAAMLAR